MTDRGDQIQIVRIEGEGVKSVATLLMVLIVAFITTTPLAIWAVVTVSLYKAEMDKEMDDLRWSNRQGTYWMEQVSSKADAMNLGFPKPPDFTAHQPKRR